MKIEPEEKAYISQVCAEDDAERRVTAAQWLTAERDAAELVPAAGGKVEVLGYRMDKASGNFECSHRDEPVWHYFGNPDEYKVTELVDRAHVTRLTAENARLQAENARLALDEIPKHGRRLLAQVRAERDALQSDLTKALELNTKAEALFELMWPGLHPEHIWAKAIEDYRAHQSAPAAKGTPQRSDVNEIPALQNEWVKP